MLTLGALMLASLGVVAPASPAPHHDLPVVLPCTLPMNVPHRLSLTQHLITPEGRPVTIRVQRAVSFGRDSAGQFLDASPAMVTTNDKGARVQRLKALYEAADPMAMRVRLSERAEVVGIAGEEAHWSAFLAAQRDLISRLAEQAPDGRDERARLAYYALSNASPARRRAILTGFLEPVMRFCGQIVTDAVARDDNHILRRDSRPAGGNGIAEDVTYRIDARTGLAIDVRRIATPAADPARRLDERWTLEPASQ